MQQVQQMHAYNLKVKEVEQKRIVEEANRELKKVTEELHKMELELATTTTKVSFYEQYFQQQPQQPQQNKK